LENEIKQRKEQRTQLLREQDQIQEELSALDKQIQERQQQSQQQQQNIQRKQQQLQELSQKIQTEMNQVNSKIAELDQVRSVVKAKTAHVQSLWDSNKSKLEEELQSKQKLDTWSKGKWQNLLHKVCSEN
jgi:ABC-type transporter Mla subunit MlaD